MVYGRGIAGNMQQHLAYIDKDLAENSIRGLYDFQDSAGMIPDCIFAGYIKFYSLHMCYYTYKTTFVRLGNVGNL